MTRILEQSTHTATEDDITASTVQTQGQETLTAENNIITTVANDNDVVTLASVDAGLFQRVINAGANILQIFPASGQDLGSGVNDSTLLAPGDHIEFLGLDAISSRNVAATAAVLGSVVGPASSSNNGIARFDGTTGKLIQDSFGTINDIGVLEIIRVQSKTLPSTSFGFIGMANADSIHWRNSSNTSDHTIGFPSDEFEIAVDGTFQYTFSATNANWFGNNLLGVGFVSSNATTPSTSGFIRMGNSETISWRNNASDGNLSLSVDVSDNLTFAGVQFVTSLLTADLDFDGNNALQIGFLTSNVTPVAGTGFLRMAVTDNITWRNNGGVGDLSLSINGSDKLVFNGIELLTPATGLTSPLTVDLDFGGNNAINVASIGSDAAFTPTGGFINMPSSGILLWRNNANTNNHELFWNLDKLLISINVNPEYTFGATELDFDGNNAIKVGFITSNISLVAGTGFLRMGNSETVSWRNNAANADLSLSIDGSDNLLFNGSSIITSPLTGDFDFNGNGLSNAGFIETDAALPALVGKIRLGITEAIAWRNPANDGEIQLLADTDNYLKLSGGKGIDLENNAIIRWNSDDGRRITNDTAGFIFDIKSNSNYDFKINDLDEYRYNATEANFLGNNLRNVGFFESNAATASAIGAIRLGNNETIGWRNGQNNDNATFGYVDTDQFVLSESNRTVQLKLDANRTNPLPNDIVSQILFTDNNSIGSARTYAQIFTLIENSTDGSERGSMALAVGDGLSTSSFIVLNEGDRDSIVIKKSLDLQKINAAPPDPPIEEGRLFVSTVDGANNALFVKIKQNNVIVEVKLT